MPRVRQLFVWVRVVLWLPATLHCAMDRAGLFEVKPVCCDDEKAQAADTKSCAERCSLLDGGAQKLAVDLVKAPAPVLRASLADLIEGVPETLLVPQIYPMGRYLRQSCLEPGSS